MTALHVSGEALFSVKTGYSDNFVERGLPPFDRIV